MRNILLKKRPILIVFISYIAGILSFKWLINLSLSSQLLLFIIFIVLFLSLLFVFRKKITDILILSSFYIIGGIFIKLALYTPNYHIKNFKGDIYTIYGRLTDNPIQGSGKTHLLVELERVNNLKTTGLLKIILKDNLYIKPEKLVFGDIIAATGFLKEPPQKYKNYLFNKKIYKIMYANWVVKIHQSRSLLSPIYKIKDELSSIYSIYNELPYYHTAILLKALILGQKQEIPYMMKKSFIKAGVWHLLVVSGWHIGMLIFFFVICMRPFLGDKKIIYLISLLIIFVYLLLIGVQAPALRAVILASGIIFAKMINRDYDIYNILSFCGLVMLIYNPLYLFDLSFQLSFLATLGIIHLRHLFDFFKNIKILNLLFKAVGVSISANLAILPLLVENFGKISTISPLTTLLLTPFVEALIILGIILAGIGFFIPTYPAFFFIFAKIANYLSLSIIIFIEFITKLPFVYITFPHQGLHFTILYYLWLLLLPYRRWRTLSHLTLLLLINTILIKALFL